MTLQIFPVEGRRAISRFIDVPWHIYDPAEHPQWVPPLRRQVRDLLDARRNPFYERAAIKLWMAVDDDRPVGRIAAIENQAHNQFHDDKVGFFGFFESVDRQEVADGLLELAGGWLRARGLNTMRGPMSPSTNHDCGMLIRGFRWPPSFLTTWNPRYYPELMDGTGMVGAKDLVSYFLPNDDDRLKIPEGIRRAAQRARERGGISFRSIDLSKFAQEVDRIWEVYQSAWEPNWGFVPVSKAEFTHIAGDLKPLLVEDFIFFAEVDGEPVGFMLVVPDFNQVLARIPNGRLFPTGFLKILLGKKKIVTGRIMAAGIKAEYRTRGIFPLFIDELKRRGQAYGGLGTDASWILEDNRALRDPIEALGAKVTRRWRIYDRSLDGR